MAVPPTQPTRAVAAEPTGLARALRAPSALDVVLGALVAVTLPLAIVALPNTISVVSALLPRDISPIGMMRAHGLALPATVLTVPLAALAVRRRRVAPMLVAGLALFAVADAAGGYADSTSLVGVLRVLHGVGAGLVVPATLAAVWERSPFLRALWCAVLAASLLAAQALALWPLDEARSWRVALQPYPMLTGVALVLAAAYFVLRLRDDGARRPDGARAPDDARKPGGGQETGGGGRGHDGGRETEPGGPARPAAGAPGRGRPLMAVVPAAGIAALALGSTYDWSPGLLLTAATLSIVALFGLASASVSVPGGADGRVPAYTVLVMGVVVLPTAAQVTNVELSGLGGPGLSGLWPAFVIAGVAAVVAAVAVGRLSDALLPTAAASGMAVVVAGLCTVEVLLPSSAGPVLVLPLVLLAVGAAVALTSALRPSGIGAALFALSLFFPGVLSGFLLGSGVQFLVLRGAGTPEALVDAFVDALHRWALVGGGLVITVIVLGALLVRRSQPSVSDAPRPSAPAPLPAASEASGAPRSGTAGVTEVPEAATGDVLRDGWPSTTGSRGAPARGGEPGMDPGAETEAEMGAEPGRKEGGEPGGPRPGPKPRFEPVPEPGPKPWPRPERTGTMPVVPPPTPSPEDTDGPGRP
ncbi:hypothetical protein [Streptosporangium sandarakinum]|uniref:hypothetical protein n=1 Tax=Streptosporangium sandarakinum TaxID=1260955 RepID=UPI00343A217E